MKYIYGLSRSGKSIIRYLDRINEIYFCWDDDSKTRDQLKTINQNINLIDPNKLDYKIIDESFISPGISLNKEKFNILRKNKVKMYRDLELYSQLTKDKIIISVTGTNGKSTTTKLISDLLTKSDLENFIGGNIGTPLLDFSLRDEIKYHVIELSSFQLESTISFNPYVSILLNISPDHLDSYISSDEYILQKEKIIKYNKSGFNIICVDDKKTLEIYEKYKNKCIPISSIYNKNGIYFKDDIIIDNYFENKKEIDIGFFSPSLYGSFNKQNILATYAVSKVLNLKKENFINLINNFVGLPHRLEKIFQNNSIQIINNSKATNVNAAINSIKNFDQINLILGGRAKEKIFKEIIKYKNKINKIYLIGESSIIIHNQLKDKIKCNICETLDNALKEIFTDIKKKVTFQTILFSPACTSYDQFNNFEERGEYFKKIVSDLVNV